MVQLKAYLSALLEKHRVEPNGALGKAAAYFIRHWHRLTLFLHEPGVPIDNSLCEQAIKKFVLLRKNSLFYKNLFGALVGDGHNKLEDT